MNGRKFPRSIKMHLMYMRGSASFENDHNGELVPISYTSSTYSGLIQIYWQHEGWLNMGVG
jgi:hypothetical protein